MVFHMAYEVLSFFQWLFLVLSLRQHNGTGRKKWYSSNINQILWNEKYNGDALLQKSYTVDFLTKKRVKNNGIVPQYYVKTIMKLSSRVNFSCRSKKSLSVAESFTPAPVARIELLAVPIAFLKLFSAAIVAKYSAGSTGTTVARNPSSGAAPAGLKTPDSSEMPELFKRVQLRKSLLKRLMKHQVIRIPSSPPLKIILQRW